MFDLEKLGYKIEIPPSEIEADLAIPAFKLDKERIAAEIKASQNPFIAEAKIVGNYINIKLNPLALIPDFVKPAAEKDDYGKNNDGQKKTVLIEYSSPNIAKPLHIGHLRNTLLGRSLKNIYEANGYKVVTENWIGDWGKQYGLIALAYQQWGSEAEFKKQPTKHLFDLYVRISQEAEANPDLHDEARKTFKKIEDGDKDLLKLWKKFRDASIKDFKSTYKRLGIDFDIWNGESFYTKFMPAIQKAAIDKGIAKKETDGPLVVDLSQYGLRSFLLAKSDGASLYSTRDLATTKWRLETYDPEKIIYVIAHEQELHIRQVFKTMELFGHPKEKFVHVNYGIVTMAGSKMSTRAGNVVFLDDIIDEAIKKAGNETIGLGALTYNILAQGNERDMHFSWEKALNLEGNSAPYIMYGYVRCLSILSKAPNYKFQTPNKFQIKNDLEKKLIKRVAFYPEFVRQACQLNEPHVIASYLNNLVQEFNRFYANCPVLEAGEEVKRSRLLLIKAVANIIKSGLWLLGIQTVKKM